MKKLILTLAIMFCAVGAFAEKTQCHYKDYKYNANIDMFVCRVMDEVTDSIVVYINNDYRVAADGEKIFQWIQIETYYMNGEFRNEGYKHDNLVSCNIRHWISTTNRRGWTVQHVDTCINTTWDSIRAELRSKFKLVK